MRPTLPTEMRSSAISYKQFFAVGLLSLFGYASTASAATFTVSNEAELRAAVNTATSRSADDTIDLGGNTIVLSDGEIEVSLPPEASLDFVNGTLDGGSASRILNFSQAIPNVGFAIASFSNITLRNGSYTTSNGPAEEAGGGAIFSNGVSLILLSSSFENNTIVGAGTGGAIFVRDAAIDINNSEFLNNEANLNGEDGETSGGAIGSLNAGNIDIFDSTFAGNIASRGGAIAPVNHIGTTNIEGSTFANNQANNLGGAIWYRGRLQILASTFFDNSAGTGGGALYLQPSTANDSSVILRSTFVDNSSNTRANTIFFASGGAVNQLMGSILVDNEPSVGNESNANCELSGTASFTADSNNFSDDESCGSAVLVGDPSTLFTTGSLANNGGLTETIALSGGDVNVAINNGIPAGGVGCLAGSVDQRGEPIVDNCDAGSYELQPIITDIDNDNVPDENDNCPMVPNENQDDFNQNGTGDACEDSDNDGDLDADDNCPLVANPNQLDFDQDGPGDACDDDDDNDGVNDLDDAFPFFSDETVDTDGDGIGNNADTDDDGDGQSDDDELECGSLPLEENSLALDSDGDNIPNCVDDEPFSNDIDEDGVLTDDDNCPAIANPNQLDFDLDGAGDACDSDDDGDGVLDINDAFPLDAAESIDTDGDSVGNNTDVDDDNDGQSDAHEAACFSDPLLATSLSPDADSDGIPDCVDDDFVVNTEPVTVYRDANFSGGSLNVGLGEVSIADLRNSPVGNDRISSIEIAPGYEVLACVNSRFRGRCETFNSNTPELSSIGLNDTISSFEVRLVSDSPVTIFRDANFSGASLGVDLGDVTIGDLINSTIGNDTISSIRIASGYEVEACLNSGMRGRCETFTNDTADLRSIQFDNVISSLEVRLISAATLFRDVNFAGASLSVGEGEVSINDLRNSPVGNDRLSSIRIAPNFSVVACSNSGMRGRCITFFNDTPDLRTIQFNDTISSLLVRSTL